MNKYSSLFLFTFLFLLCACKEDPIDFDTKRNNIIGTWEVTQATQEIRADTLYAEYSSGFEITFNENGTGIRQTFLNTEVRFEWLYQYNPEMVVTSTIEEDLVFLNISNTEFYSISKNEVDRQIWEFEVRPKMDVVDVYKHTWKMDKK